MPVCVIPLHVECYCLFWNSFNVLESPGRPRTSFNMWEEEGFLEVTEWECVKKADLCLQSVSSWLRSICHRVEIKWWRLKNFLPYSVASTPTQQPSPLAEGYVHAATADTKN